MIKKFFKKLKSILIKINKGNTKKYFVHETAIYNVKANVIIGTLGRLHHMIMEKTIHLHQGSRLQNGQTIIG